MSTEKEFINWLNRQNKSVTENFQFAIKAWNSVEFALPTKYDIVISYFVENFTEISKADENDFENIINFLNLKCSLPGLINVQTKLNSITAFIKFGKMHKEYESRKICEILFQVVQQECYQDFYKHNYDKYLSLFGLIYRHYKNYLENRYINNETFLHAYESEFFKNILNNLTDFVKRLPENCIEEFSKNFSKMTLKPLVETIILLKSNNLKYFEEIVEIEKILFVDYTTSILKNHLTFPIHVNLINIECGLINFRGNIAFYQRLIEVIFKELQISDEFSSPNMFLTINAYVLEMLKKYDVKLNFEYDGSTILQYLSKQIENFVNSHCTNNLFEILCLLCSTIRLNPLILEHNILNITAKIIVAKKSDKDYEKFEEFLILLIDMFKKLSRAEKFIVNFLKSIEEHLINNKLSKKLKRKIKTECETPAKKMKLENNSVIIEEIDNRIEVNNLYIKIMLSEFRKKSNELTAPKLLSSNNFYHISFAWPSGAVSVAFSKFISSLMSKPSLTIWKTLIYKLDEHVETLKSSEIDENLLFLIDLCSVLLCEYLAGTRLVEQADKFWSQINENRLLTQNVLKKFGQIILNLEHNNRTMNAFLQIAYNLGIFDLISWYYSPDSLSSSIDCVQNSKNLHNFLSQDEWILIKQRIVNFGKKDCKLNMNRICMQNIKGKLLFEQNEEIKLNNHQLNVKNVLLSSTLSNPEQVKAIFIDPSNYWLVKYLTKNQKYEICELILIESIENQNSEYLNGFIENHELFEIILLNLYKNLGECFNKKKSILASVDFDNLKNSNDNEQNIKNVIKVINEKNDDYSIKKISDGQIENLLNLLKKLPIGFAKDELKILIFSLHLALYRDTMATGKEDLANTIFEMFDDILHFGRQIEFFKYYEIENLLKIFLPSKSPKFYEFLFNTLRKTDGNAAEKSLETTIKILKVNEPQLSTDNLKLLIILIEVLSHQSNLKKFKIYLEEIIQIYGNYLNSFFIDDKRDTEKDKKFVESTLQAFSIYINAVLSKVKKSDEKNQIDDKFRKICKIYIGYSIDSHNYFAIRLINSALNHRVQLHFDADEIQFVMQKYWEQLKIYYQNKDNNDKKLEAAMKLVMTHKSVEDFRNILMDIGKDITVQNIAYKCRMLTEISQCRLSLIKGAILNEQFKLITFNATLKLEKDPINHQFIDINAVLNLLKSMKVICANTKIPMSPDHIDDILTFLININVKKFIINDLNANLFKQLHEEMSELSLALIKFRHQMVTDRIPQFVYIFKDLLQAICCYKSEREKDITLLSNEIEDLAELVQKLENLMHSIASHSLEVKRVAPYLLTFVINLMVTNKRSTTLYPKIKTHVDSICYDLVSVCDHRVGSFILRCSNDATKHVYETLCKEFKKYHKFKGKV